MNLPTFHFIFPVFPKRNKDFFFRNCRRQWSQDEEDDERQRHVRMSSAAGAAAGHFLGRMVAGAQQKSALQKMVAEEKREVRYN